jgi:fructokinase
VVESVGFGAILWDDIPAIDDGDNGLSCAQNIGGSVFNVLVHLREFGHEAYMVSALGDDALGARTFDTIEKMGVRKDYIAVVPEETCLVKVTFDKAGSPHYSAPEVASWDNIALSEERFASLRQHTFDYLVYGTLEQRDPRSRATLRRVLAEGVFRNIYVDLTLRKFYTKELLEETMRRATILKMNDEEAMEVNRLFGFNESGLEMLVKRMAREFGNQIACITAGEKGAYVGDSTFAERSPAYKTTVCDTVGCGDAFSAAFLAKHSQGAPLTECCDYGNRFAALIASKRSSCPDYDISEVEHYVERA